MTESKKLIPDDVRALYEQLIGERHRIVSDDDPMWTSPVLRELLKSGLGSVIARQPPIVVPARPEVVWARLMAIWRDAANTRIEAHRNIQREAARFHYIAMHQKFLRAPGDACLIFSESHEVSALQDRLYCSAERLTRQFTTGPYGEPRRLPDGQPHTINVEALYIAPESEYHARGGKNKELCDREFADAVSTLLVRGHEDGEEIRIVENKLPMKMLIVDGHTALVALGPYGHPCLLLRDPRLVAVFAAFFDAKWSVGVPWEKGEASPSKENVTQQRVLDSLVAGLKDEAIARHLGISTRTVRRHVAQIMRDLGSTTRFAAGVAAVRQGLVPQGSIR